MTLKYYLHDIVWPASLEEAIKLLIQYEVDVLKALNYEFPQRLEDPIGLTEDYLRGIENSEAIEALIDQCWGVLGTKENINNLKDHLPLGCQLALSLVPDNKRDDPLDEHLYWFLEFLQAISPEYKKYADSYRKEFFKYSK